MTNDEAFKIAMKHIFKWEGYISDDAGDPGGLTKYGVCLEYLKDLGVNGGGDIVADKHINRKDVLGVTKEKAEELFKKSFWTTPGADTFPPLTAIVYFDSAVNTGVRQTNKLLQRALGVADDGIVGPATKKKLAESDDAGTSVAMLDQRERFYRGLAAKRPQFKKFLKGWLNRVNDCRALIKSLV